MSLDIGFSPEEGLALGPAQEEKNGGGRLVGAIEAHVQPVVECDDLREVAGVFRGDNQCGGTVRVEGKVFFGAQTTVGADTAGRGVSEPRHHCTVAFTVLRVG